MNNELIQHNENVSINLTNLNGFELAQRAAKLLASSTLMPKEFQGNISNCVIALNMAHRMGADPLMVAQNLIVVHGRPTWSSQFLIATFNSCGRFSAMRFEFSGEPNEDNYGCRAYATELSTGEKIYGTRVTIGIAKAEGWYGRNGSKWRSMSEQMLRYRAASWFVRTIAPELSMGLHTADEVIDITDYQEIKPTQRKSRTVESIVDDAEEITEIKPSIVDLKPGNKQLDEEIDQETGEIIEQQAEPEADHLADWKAKTDECASVSDISRLLKEMPDEIKKDAEMYAYLKTRQSVIKAADHHA